MKKEKKVKSKEKFRFSLFHKSLIFGFEVRVGGAVRKITKKIILLAQTAAVILIISLLFH